MRNEDSKVHHTYIILIKIILKVPTIQQPTHGHCVSKVIEGHEILMNKKLAFNAHVVKGNGM